jgi:hypothetical protein
MAGMKAASETPPVDAETAIRNALKSPVISTGLDLRSTTYVMHGDNASMTTVRVVVLGDVARGAPGPATATAVLYDQDGKPVTSDRSTIEIPAGDAPAPLQTALAVKPGAYLLRVAVRDAEGKIGTVERTVEARWVKAGNAETTGLVLFRQKHGGAPEPLFESVTTADQVIAQLAINGGSAVPEVAVEVRKDNVEAPLMKGTARVAKTTAGSTLAQYVVPTALLPPGRYTVGAMIGRGASKPFTRSFLIEASPAAPAEGETTTSVSRKGPSLASLLSLARPAQFASASVLDPSFVEPMIARLAERPDVAPVRDAVERMKSGPWPTDSATGPLASAPVAATFVAGLGKLQAGDLEAAATDFRATLRLAPDFSPAMVYLGACYAAGTKNKEAASAWQTALLRERASPTLTALAIDAWMRAERPAAALTLLKSARVRWPDNPIFPRQQAQATLADGRTREGIELVMAMPEPGESLLFFSLGTLYHAILEKKPVWDPERDRKTMRELRESYAKASGASLPLVDAWLGEIEAGR